MRKRYYFAAAAMVMALALAGCANGSNKESDSSGSQESSSLEETVDKETEEALQSESGLQADDNGETTRISALSILETVWASYGEDELFAAMGGDSANSVMDAPGAFDYTNEEELEALLHVPQGNAQMMDEAASLMHMMNANTFTCGAYHIGDPADVQIFADELQAGIQGTQWICGFPEKLLIVTVDEQYVVAAFGNGEVVGNFKEKLDGAYESVEILYDEAIQG